MATHTIKVAGGHFRVDGSALGVFVHAEMNTDDDIPFSRVFEWDLTPEQAAALIFALEQSIESHEVAAGLVHAVRPA